MNEIKNYGVSVATNELLGWSAKVDGTSYFTYKGKLVCEYYHDIFNEKKQLNNSIRGVRMKMNENELRPGDIFWGCMEDYFETARKNGIIQSEVHMNESLHRALYGITRYWINNYHLRNVFKNKPFEWSKCVNDTCFESGLILAKELRDNSNELQLKYCDMVSGTYSTAFDIDGVQLKCDWKQLHLMLKEINDTGESVREHFKDYEESSEYIFNTFFAVTQLGVAVFEESGL